MTPLLIAMRRSWLGRVLAVLMILLIILANIMITAGLVGMKLFAELEILFFICLGLALLTMALFSLSCLLNALKGRAEEGE